MAETSQTLGTNNVILECPFCPVNLTAKVSSNGIMLEANHREPVCQDFLLSKNLEVIVQAVTNSEYALNRIAVAYAPLQVSQRKLEIRDHGMFREGLTSDELTVGSVRTINEGEHCILGSVNAQMQRFLYTKAQKHRPKVALEFGTCFGVSAAAIAFGMGSVGPSQLVSIEADPMLVGLARHQLKTLGLDWVEVRQNRFQDELENLGLKDIELVFDDGDHTGWGEAQRFASVLPFCAPKTLFIWDDIRLSKPMNDWWKHVSKQPQASEVHDYERYGSLVWNSTE